MSNHIHILVHEECQLELFVKKLASSYVFYFNRKHERIGHLFQDRFRSEAVEDDRYLLAVFRYILQNPWKARICRPEEYAWSSWNTLTGRKSVCNIDAAVDAAGDLQALAAFVAAETDDAFLDIENNGITTESQALERAMKITGGVNPQKIAAYDKKTRDMILAKMKKAGISVRQISRLTGLNRNVVQRADESRDLSPRLMRLR